MKIASVGCALPENRYEQSVLTEAMLASLDAPEQVRRRMTAMHGNVKVGHRHLALPLEAYLDLDSFGKANDAWIRAALDLGEKAMQEALDLAGLGVHDVNMMFNVSVTGIANPCIGARLINRMGLRSDVKRVPIFGLGCVAGVAGIARAIDYVKGHPSDVAVLLCVELCSLNLQRGDHRVANLIATGLFADGAAAVVVVGEERARSMGLEGPTVLSSRSVFYPDTERVMGWDISEEGFQIVLSAQVPSVAREHLGRDVESFLESQGCSIRDIASWVCHPGGPKVLEAVQDALGLRLSDVAHSWAAMAETGNLSSASVLMVLRRVLEHDRPSDGDLGMLVAMGPGFCSELVLVRW